MVRFTERAIDGWQDGQTRDTHADMFRLTLDIVAQTLFSVDIAEVAREIEWALEVLTARFRGVANLIPIGLPTPGNYRTRRAIERLDEIVYGVIRDRRQTGKDTGDLLSMLLAATSDESHGGMDDKCLVAYVKETFEKDPSYDPFKAGGAARTLHESTVLAHVESACTEAKTSGDDGKRGSCKALCNEVATFRTKYPNFYVGDDVNPPATELRSLCATLDVLVPKGGVKASPASRAKVTE